MKTRLLIALFCAALAACAGGPAYRPAPAPGDFGYRDSAVTKDRYQVSFSGDYSMARETVEKFALYRAADVTLAHGVQRFRITSRQTLPITTNDYGPTTGLGYGFGYPFWGSGIGYSIGGSSQTRFDTVLEIQIGPEVPQRGPSVYNAQQVKHNLQAAVVPGQH